MNIGRRAFVSGLVATPALISAQAAPILSAGNNSPTEAIAKRGNAWLEISKSGFEANLARQRAAIGPTVKLCAVMKADAYGHGIALLIGSVIRHKVEYVGFTSNDEARIARTLGFRGQLARLRLATPQEIEAGLRYDIEELVGNLDYAKDAARIARSQRKRLRYHLALNSAGMSRNGLEVGSPEGMDEALQILELPDLHLVGIMTHYPVDDEEDVRHGLAAFNTQSSTIITRGGLDASKLTLHTASSFATIKVPESHLNMVRVGGNLYGDTVPDSGYEPIATFKSEVAAILHYPAGDTVCYDRTYKLSRPSVLANIPVGYSDGYRRVFSNGNVPPNPPSDSVVLIHGKKVPVVGRITMNTFMVDVTDLDPGAHIGDEVVLLGRQDGAEISYSEMETQGKTIAADLYTVWGNSLPKILVP